MDLRLTHLIDGEARGTAGGAALDVFEPATGRVYAACPEGTAADVDAAVAAARRAFPAWSALPAADRAAWINKLADALEARLDEFAAAESRDVGKPLALARSLDIPRAVSNLRFFAAAATQFASESHSAPGVVHYTLRQPLGVVGVISPWNLPLYLFTWKFAPALAAGNCVVGKPSEVTPVTAWMLGELARGIGFPAGVFNIVQGRGAVAGQALVDHPDVKAISFTGSTAVGVRIAESCARSLKKTSLELGGKNATLVFADAPKEKLLDTVVRSAFLNSGACWSSAATTRNSAMPWSPARKRWRSATRTSPKPSSAPWSRERITTRCWPAWPWPGRKAARCCAAAKPCGPPAAAPTAGSSRPPSSKAWARTAAPTPRRSSARW